jgi:putative NADH-flavin reductase
MSMPTGFFFILSIAVLIESSTADVISKKIAIVGASGELGRALTKQAIDHGHAVTAIVRNRQKLNSMFSEDILTKINVIVGDTGSTDAANFEFFTKAFAGQDVVIETLSNSQRPNGVKFLVHAAESAGVEAFMACGGAGILFESKREDAKRVYETLSANMAWLIDVSKLHMDVQKLAFSSQIPIVTQFCPPGMKSGQITGKAVPTMGLSLAVWEMTYDDVASTVLGVIPVIEEYNRKMIGFRMQKRVMTILSHNGEVRKQHEMLDREETFSEKSNNHRQHEL